MSRSANQSLSNDVAQLRDIAKAQQKRIDALEKLVAIHEEMHLFDADRKVRRKGEKLNEFLETSSAS